MSSSFNSNTQHQEGASGSIERVRPSKDIGWEHGQPLEKGNLQKVKCDYCKGVFTGGVKRLKQHIVGGFRDARKCGDAPKEAVQAVKEFMEGKKKEIDNKKKAKEAVVRSVNIYSLDDEDDSVTPTSRVKSKGPMDTFLAPVDVDYTPHEPQSAQNKRALVKVGESIADFFYENGLAFNAAQSESYVKMCQSIVQYNDPQSFKPPSYHDLRVTILKKKVQDVKEWINGFKVHWETYGCTIMTDWWTDKKKRTLINFLVNCPKGTVFLKSIDGTQWIHNAELIHGMLKEVIQEVGEKNVIQIVTDQASNYKLAGKWIMEESKIYWTPCAAHCVNLMLSDVSDLPLVHDLVEEAKCVTIFIYNHTKVLHLMRNHTDGRDIVRPSVTRFATSFLCLQSIFEQKQKLRNMIASPEWTGSKWAKTPTGKDVRRSIKRSTFWNHMHYALKIMAPLVDVVRLVDTEEKPSMGYIYKAMEICKEKVKKNLGEENEEDKEMWKVVEAIIDDRWKAQLNQPLHAAAYYLNPMFYYATPTSPEEMESNGPVKEGLLECITKLTGDLVEEKKIIVQLVAWRTRRGRLGKPNAVACVNDMAPVEWWVTFGSEIPELQRFAKRVLGLTTSASPCERNWSTFSNLHTKKRNKLDHQRLNDLVYIQYNKRLKRRYESRINGPESDPIILDNLDACIEWLVPHDSRKDPVMGTDFNWGMLEDAEGSEHDEPPPPTTRQYKRRRVSQSQPERTSTSRGGRGKGKGVASRSQLHDSSTDEDESALVLSDKSDDEDDGLNSGEEEDL